MNPVLEAWNAADTSEANQAMLACCGAQRWAGQMVALRPITTIATLSEAADRVWAAMGESDWLEAFACHPRIGERKAPSASEQSSSWSQQEQSGTTTATQSALRQLAEDNALYEQRFRFTYIVCATGKSAEEMLAILQRRLGNTRVAELREAAEEQRQIMQIRLGKWLVS
ncbi:MAG TPA: 2-oxo-4-hydroxy-4-carboxy-5-ureidoimidazoline decarboxylase [Terracidiphilus sp.]|jgi:2-oxo-4-hydroxy-4-carboxy-5-ureidoimidazoline decarboxylase|nr:2-oxo-4-hydroxy-4-carboxy-5-ureidoimidazoline decarboxylase [Terracidiphilus sp.]